MHKKTAHFTGAVFKTYHLMVANVYSVPFPVEPVVVSAGVSEISAGVGVGSVTGAGLDAGAAAGFLATGFFFCGGVAFFATGFLGATFFTTFLGAAFLGAGRFAAFFTAFLATFFGAAFFAAFFFTATFLAAFLGADFFFTAAFLAAFFFGAGLAFAFFLEGILQDFGVND